MDTEKNPLPQSGANAPAPLYGPHNIIGGAQPREKAPITASMKRLLIGSALIGLVAQAMLNDAVKAYALIWAVYMAVFCALNREGLKKAPRKLAPLPFAATIVVMMILQSQGYSGVELIAINTLALPGILLIHALYVVFDLPKGREAYYIFLLGRHGLPWFFSAISRFYSAIAALFSKDGKTMRVWAGVLVAIPLSGVALSLLISADAVMGVFARRIFSGFDISDIVVRGIILLLFAALSYSFLYNTRWGENAFTLKEPTLTGATAARIVVSALVLVYSLFTAVQFVYLFGGYGLPEGLTYSQYAVEGFSQLIWVAVINFSVLAYCLTRVQGDKPLKILLILLMAATGVILASSFTRLCLYIGAYNLTLKRVLAFWLLCYLSLVLAAGLIRLFKKGLPMLRITAIALVVWYTALNIVDLSALYKLAF